MSVEDYLKNNINPDTIKEANDFLNSSSYSLIENYSKSEKFQNQRNELKLRDKHIHKNTLSEIQKLQDNIFIR